MSAARFRGGRYRLFAGFFIIVIVIVVVAMYHSSAILCENNLETMRKQAESQRYQMERVKEQETNKHLQSERTLEDKLKEQREHDGKEILDLRRNLEQLQQTHNLLKNNHDKLVNECAITKKKQLDDANSLEKKLQALRAELKKAKTLQDNEVELWKVKFNAVVNDKALLEKQQASNRVQDTEKRMKLLENIVAEFSSNCVYKPKNFSKDFLLQQQINKPLQTPETTQNGAAFKKSLPSFDRPKNEKNFNLQESIAPKPLKKLSVEDIPETQLKQQPDSFSAGQVQAAGGQVLPLSAPRKFTSTQSTKTAQRVLEQANISSLVSTSSSTSLPPLPLPPNQQRKKLPAMVAPIPSEFDQFIKDENEKQQQQQQDSVKKKGTVDAAAGGVDIDAAIENDDQGTNIRYANVVSNMDGKKTAKFAAGGGVGAGGGGADNQNEEIGSHEIKDNEDNLPADENGNHFFDAGDKNAGGDLVNGADEDDLGLGGGVDIAVKNHNLLEADSLNNEVAGDQGKEFPDGLRLEDANEEDEDEDEYANPVARQQGAQAIRN